MIWILTILLILYLSFVMFLILGWESMPNFLSTPERVNENFLTVIVPCRNEEKRIADVLRCLEKQTFPSNLFEVIVVNDHSDDNTVQVVQKLIHQRSINIKLISLAGTGKAGKKKAIEEGISHARGNLIVSTDADCKMGEHWLACIEEYHYRTGARMVCGPVAFSDNHSFWGQMLQVEFASLVGTSGASLALRIPNMCNGANIAYDRDVFFEVGGFSGNEDVASGDDEFLMHKIFKRYPGKVKFLKSSEAVVQTPPPAGLKEFFHQRVRWAGKWKNYNIRFPKFLAGFIFLLHLAFVMGWISIFTGHLDPSVFLQQIVIKILFEFVFLKRVMALYGQKINVFSFLLVELVYPFYVVLTALLTFKGTYVWKGRTIKTLNFDRSRI